jgi:hypothetical protein
LAILLRVRAYTRIGELVRELDTAEHAGPGQYELPNGGKFKAEAIADAGLSKSEAYRYQELAGGRDEQDKQAGGAASEARVAFLFGYSLLSS